MRRRRKKPASIVPTTTAPLTQVSRTETDAPALVLYHVFATPAMPTRSIVTNLGMWKSTDGGVSYAEINTPHGDNHDCGATGRSEPHGGRQRRRRAVTYNGGATGRRSTTAYRPVLPHRHRQPLSVPRLCHAAGQYRDRRTERHRVGRDHVATAFYPASGESGFIAVHPRPQHCLWRRHRLQSRRSGALQRYRNALTRSSWSMSGLRSRPGVARRHALPLRLDLSDRVFAARQQRAICRGNHVFRTRNEGMSWEEISPDLSLNDVSRQGHSGGGHHPRKRRRRGACHLRLRGRIAAPQGRDLGLDRRWPGARDTQRRRLLQNVTPPRLPELAYVGCVRVFRATMPTPSTSPRPLQAVGLPALLYAAPTAASPGSRSTADSRPTKSPVWCAPIRSAAACCSSAPSWHLLQPR